ncbi:recombination endonuclease VII [Streptomyces sp. WAC 01529]|uniref:endonuclease VII domain-containing protein n=1 Tax=Streptomyces sp. WAC 01529 TaxID=2203205 RepID=UPI000F6D7D02|nr:endonuclease VII domain-containing protein [Streptomyces sp. WAC 01529]AZM51824.1 recombination endonuclease VII [Streptomyces sp. WAC 01529]
MPPKKRRCKDCPEDSKRPAPYPGPRCATCHRAVKKRRREAAHELAVQNTYGLAAGDYAKLYRLQGGRCAICRRATGATRRLSVDHDHASGAVRGLLCRPCNSMLGHARDELDFFIRAHHYLFNPPARRLRGDAT